MSVTIKAILERYPDGQIFKVAIHNNNCGRVERGRTVLHTSGVFCRRLFRMQMTLGQRR